MSAQESTRHSPQRVGVVAESAKGETRVAATPSTVRGLLSLGYEVVVESNAGSASGFSDEAYTEAGAAIGDPWAGDIVLKVNAPTIAEVARLNEGATVAGLIAPAQHPELLQELASRRVTALALDGVPRITRAQSMDVLSSMANIAGYRAVVEAAHEFGRFFTGQVTAAGKVPPAKVLVAGRRRGWAGGDRRRRQPGRDRACDRPAAGGRRPGQVAGRRVPAGRYGRGGGPAPPATPRRWARTTTARPPRAVRAIRPGRRHHHHHRADPRAPGAAADHAEDDGRVDEAGQRDRGHGRRATAATSTAPSRAERSSPTTASRSSATPTSPAGCPRRPPSCTARTWST